MRCRIRQQGEDATSREKLLDVTELSIGRGSNCAVQLPGLLVSSRHARIWRTAAGELQVSSDALAGVELDGVPGVRQAPLQPGSSLRIGDHEIVIEEPDHDAQLVITVIPGQSGGELSRGELKTDLQSAGMRQRGPALLLLMLVLLFGLFAPLASDYLPATLRDAPGVPTDEFWISGEVSSAHGHFRTDCKACHVKPFVKVEDDACFACHAKITHHSADPNIREVGGFLRRCANCHREHGPEPLANRSTALCLDCHRDPDFSDFPDLPAAGDFARAHPNFRPRVNIILPTGVRIRGKVEQSPDLRDYTPLIFPHDVHLRPAGVRGPDGLVMLGCEGCHVPDSGGVAFADIRYQRHCADCHDTRAFVAGKTLNLPHGDDAAAWQLLMEAAASPMRDAAPLPTSGRRRAGSAVQRSGPMDPEEEARDAFDKRVCGKCHEITAAEDAPQVVPTNLVHSWFTAARFTHADHQWVKCADCHEAESSASSEDLLLPAIETCRRCHTGVASSSGVRSTCIDCHRLHGGSQPWLGGDRQASNMGSLSEFAHAVGNAGNSQTQHP